MDLNVFWQSDAVKNAVRDIFGFEFWHECDELVISAACDDVLFHKPWGDRLKAEKRL